MNQTLFLIIAAAGVLSALGTVLARNLVHAALYLVAFFFTVACQFLMLEAEFLAAMQVLVYIGAVAILIMFGIMLTRNVQGDDTTTISGARRVPAVLAAVSFFSLVVFGINAQEGLEGRKSWSETLSRPATGSLAGDRAESPRTLAINNMGKAVGEELMSRYVVAFEIAGVLLTAALVGAIVLAVQDKSEDSPDLLQAKWNRGGLSSLATETAADSEAAPESSRTEQTAASV